MPSRVIVPIAILVLALALQACGGPPADGSPPASVPATSAPSATAAPASVSPSDDPATSPRSEPGGPFAEALIAALAVEDLATHIDQEAVANSTVGGAEFEVTASMSGDIAGPDLALEIEIAGAGISQAMELRIVGDTAYTRQGDAWQSAPRAFVADSLDGLMGNIRVVTDPASLRYVGPETVDGRPLHHLTGVGLIPYQPSTGGTGQYDALDIWIEEDGTPVLIKGSFSATDAAGNAATGTTEMTFSKFGQPVEIEAPIIEPAATS